jgi:hypothetical protein
MKGLRAKKADMIKEGTLIVATDIGMTSNHGRGSRVCLDNMKQFLSDKLPRFMPLPAS